MRGIHRSLASVAVLVSVLYKVNSQMSCAGQLDVVLAVDTSQSIGSTNFNLVSDAVRAFVNTVRNNNPSIHIGLVYYSSSDSLESFPVSDDYSGIISWVNTRVITASTSTRTDLAIARAQTLHASGRIDAPKVIVVITDGISERPTETVTAAEAARNAGAQVFAVGVNVVSPLFIDELEAITGDPRLVMRLDDFLELPRQLTDLAISLCSYTVCSACVVDEGTRHAPHPTRCDKFYKCERIGGVVKAHEMSCPVGTLWHRGKVTCDHISNVLSERSSSGCDYCSDVTVTSAYPLGDYCEIYYTCVSDVRMEVTCCPANEGFEYGTGCTSFASCAINPGRRYQDDDSCAGYYTCRSNGVGGAPVWTKDCCAVGFNSTSGTCVADTNNCKGTCAYGGWRQCSILFEHDTDVCMFQIRTSLNPLKYQEMNCPDGTAYDPAKCACDHDVRCQKTQRSDCSNFETKMDFSVTDSTGVRGRRFMDAVNVDFTAGVMYLAGGKNFGRIGHFSANSYAFTKGFLFRINVRDDPVSDDRTMVVLSNSPCPDPSNGGYLSEAGTLPSIYILLTPSLGQVLLGVRTTGGDAEVTLNYSAQAGVGLWKEITLRYPSPSRAGPLQGYLRLYEINPDGSTTLRDTDSGSSGTATGRIRTSDCGLKIGKGMDTEIPFKGGVDNILFYDSCPLEVPPVDMTSTVFEP